MVCCRGQYAGGVVLGFLSSTFCSQHWLQTCCDFTASTWQSRHGWSSPSAGATTIALTCCCGCDTLRQPHCPSAQTSCRVSSSQMGRRTTLHGMLTTARWARRRVCRGTHHTTTPTDHRLLVRQEAAVARPLSRRQPIGCSWAKRIACGRGGERDFAAALRLLRGRVAPHCSNCDATAQHGCQWPSPAVCMSGLASGWVLGAPALVWSPLGHAKQCAVSWSVDSHAVHRV